VRAGPAAGGVVEQAALAVHAPAGVPLDRQRREIPGSVSDVCDRPSGVNPRARAQTSFVGRRCVPWALLVALLDSGAAFTGSPWDLGAPA